MIPLTRHTTTLDNMQYPKKTSQVSVPPFGKNDDHPNNRSNNRSHGRTNDDFCHKIASYFSLIYPSCASYTTKLINMLNVNGFSAAFRAPLAVSVLIFKTKNRKKETGRTVRVKARKKEKSPPENHLIAKWYPKGTILEQKTPHRWDDEAFSNNNLPTGYGIYSMPVIISCLSFVSNLSTFQYNFK